MFSNNNNNRRKGTFHYALPIEMYCSRNRTWYLSPLTTGEKEIRKLSQTLSPYYPPKMTVSLLSSLFSVLGHDQTILGSILNQIQPVAMCNSVGSQCSWGLLVCPCMKSGKSFVLWKALAVCLCTVCGTFHLHGKVRELGVLDIALKVTAFEFCSSLP